MLTHPSFNTFANRVAGLFPAAIFNDYGLLPVLIGFGGTAIFLDIRACCVSRRIIRAVVPLEARAPSAAQSWGEGGSVQLGVAGDSPSVRLSPPL
jgi:hypothetical protein